MKCLSVLPAPQTRNIVSSALLSLVLALCLAWPVTLDAQNRGAKIHTYHDETTFLGAVGEVVVQGFESYPTDNCTTGGPTPFTTLFSESFSVTTEPLDGGTSFLCTGSAEGGPTPIEGNNALIAGSNTLDSYRLTFTVTSERPLRGVGFYVKDAAETGDLIFTIDGQDFTIAPCCQAGGNVVFFGIVTNKPITEFSVTSRGTADGLALDKLTMAFSRKRK